MHKINFHQNILAGWEQFNMRHAFTQKTFEIILLSKTTKDISKKCRKYKNE